MFDILTGSRFKLPPEPNDPDKPIGILVHSKQDQTFRKVVGKYITNRVPARANEAEFQVLGKHRDEVQELLDAHEGD